MEIQCTHINSMSSYIDTQIQVWTNKDSMDCEGCAFGVQSLHRLYGINFKIEFLRTRNGNKIVSSMKHGDSI